MEERCHRTVGSFRVTAAGVTRRCTNMLRDFITYRTIIGLLNLRRGQHE